MNDIGEILQPDVLMVTGDHSTPSTYRAHSWHPVPFVLRSRWCQPDWAEAFNEADCQRGSLGLFAATEMMPLATCRRTSSSSRVRLAWLVISSMSCVRWCCSRINRFVSSA